MIKDLLICLFFQLILFTPFFIIWIQDCNEIGKENLAVPLHERFFTFLIFVPVWLVMFLRG